MVRARCGGRWPAPSPRHPPPQTWSWTRMDTTWGHITLHLDWDCTLHCNMFLRSAACCIWANKPLFFNSYNFCVGTTLYWSKNEQWINIQSTMPEAVPTKMMALQCCEEEVWYLKLIVVKMKPIWWDSVGARRATILYHFLWGFGWEQ